MGDHNDVVFPSLCLFCSHIHNLVQRLLSPSLLADHLKVSLVIHMNDWLDLYHGSQNSRRLGYAASPLQMVQIIYRYKMADMQFIFLHPLCNLFDRLSFFFQLQCIIKQNSLSQTGAKRVNHDDLPVRILILKFLSGDTHAVICSA